MKQIKYTLFFLIISILPTSSVQALSIDFSADTSSILVGETLEIFISATNFNGSDELAGGVTGFSISSLSTLSIDSVTVDPHWDFDPTPGMLVGNTWDGINFETFINTPLNDDGLIATINITGLAAGTTTLRLLDSSTFSSSLVEFDTPQIINPSGFEITVQPVPVPAAFLLMSTALLGLAWRKRKPL